MTRRWRAGLGVTLLAGSLVLVAPVGPVAAFPGPTVDLVGHGYGHGRGMGQFGSLGYSLRGWRYEQILDHYYGGTRMGSLPPEASQLTVHLTRFDGLDVIVTQERGKLETSAMPGRFHALRAARIAPNTYRIDTGPGCGGPWTPAARPPMTGPVRFSPAVRNDDHTEMLQVCEAGGTHRWLRGDILALEGDGVPRAVNALDMESYLRGVVPRESPSSWGTAGGGAGMHALRAQAVAARSYAAAERRSGWAQTCDTTACQVYSGRAEQDAAGFRDLEPETTNRAVEDTKGQIRVSSTTGQVARTEFSSSTGGYTAGGVFPAVVDEGDAIESNPSRVWTAKIPVEVIEAARPQIGRLLAVDVTARNGLGAMGGRVQQLVLRGTAGRATLTGSELRLLYPYSSAQRPLGVRSDWFRVVNNPSGGLSGYWVTASDGGIFAFGEAGFFGSTGAMRLNQPIVGMAAAPSGRGYWLVATDGGIFAFGDAQFFGSTGAMALNKPVVGMAPTPSGRGYWLVASDGGIFAFGDAQFFGSTGAMRLNKPIVGMAATPSGRGYWLLGSDGGIFTFGDAAFSGSLPGASVPGPAVAMRPTRTGGGYLITTASGRVVAFGDAPVLGDVPEKVPGYRGGVVGLEVKAAPPSA